jgi:predicted GNAT family N-acyltransferase
VIDPRFFVEPADWHTDKDDLRAVREAVFIEEQGVSREEEWDDLDEVSQHVIARDLEGKPIGTGRLTPKHKIGRMAVLKPWRGSGVGALLLQALIQRARELHYPELELHAQVSAIGFYERFGFKAEGDEFIEADIRHRIMRATVAPLEAPVRSGEAEDTLEPELHEFDDLASCRNWYLERAREARHRLWIYTRDLDPALLDRADIAGVIRRIALSGRGAEIQILVHDTRLALQEGHRLIELLQRVSSTVQARRPSEDDLGYAPAFLLNDRGGFVFRPLGSRYEGFTDRHDRPRHRELLNVFERAWGRAEPVTDFRQLGV